MEHTHQGRWPMQRFWLDDALLRQRVLTPALAALGLVTLNWFFASRRRRQATSLVAALLVAWMFFREHQLYIRPLKERTE